MATSGKTKLTPPQIAKMWGVSRDKIIGYIRRGQLRAINVANPGCWNPRYLIDQADLAALEESLVVRPYASQTQRGRCTMPNVTEYFKEYV